MSKSSYHLTIGSVEFDYYDYCDALNKDKTYQAGDAAIEHARKKLTNPGGRSGGKDRLKDVTEAKISLERAIEQIANSMPIDANAKV